MKKGIALSIAVGCTLAASVNRPLADIPPNIVAISPIRDPWRALGRP